MGVSFRVQKSVCTLGGQSSIGQSGIEREIRLQLPR